MTLMMLMMSLVCLLKTWNRYIRFSESLCSGNYGQQYVFQVLGENLHDMANFRGYRLFPGWFNVMSVVSWFVSGSSSMVSGGFTWFRVVPGRCSF